MTDSLKMYKDQINIVLLCLLMAFSVKVAGQCDSEASDAQCVEKITSSNTFVKSYKLDGTRTGDVEFSSVLVKDTRYYLNLCEEGVVSNNVEINVYDAKRKLVTTNKNNQLIHPELSFNCDKTGVYYFVFKKGSAYTSCGMGALSFRR